MQITEEIEIVQWVVASIGAATGVAGLGWQVFKHHRSKRAHQLKMYNERVFKRWVNVFIGQADDKSYEFQVPDPPNQEVVVSGIALTDIPDFSYAETYLRKKYPSLMQSWDEVQNRLSMREDARNQLRGSVAEVVKREMSHHFPLLTPQMSRHPLVQDSYNLDVIADKVYFRCSSWIRDAEEPKFKIKDPRLQSLDEGASVWVIKDGQNHIAIDAKKGFDVKVYKAILKNCVKDNQVERSTRHFIDHSTDLDGKLKEFRSSLRRISLKIEYEYE